MDVSVFLCIKQVGLCGYDTIYSPTDIIYTCFTMFQSKIRLDPSLKILSQKQTDSHYQITIKVTQAKRYSCICVGGGGASVGGWKVTNCNKNGGGGGGAGGVSKIQLDFQSGVEIVLHVGKGGRKDFNNGDGNATFIQWYDKRYGCKLMSPNAKAEGGQHGLPYDSFESNLGQGGQGNFRKGENGNYGKTYQSYIYHGLKGSQMFEIQGAGGGSYYGKRAKGAWNGCGEQGFFPGGGAGGDTSENGQKGGDGTVIIE